MNDDSSSTAVAKLRAMNEAGNITWDVVDVEAAPAMQLCDEGLAMKPDTMLAAAQTVHQHQTTSVICSSQVASFHK